MAKFLKESTIDSNVEKLFLWHQNKGVIKRLIPPWEDVEVLKEPDNLINSEAIMLVRPLPFLTFRWHAKHLDFIPYKQFKDIQLTGPFRKWEHTHKFIEIEQNRSKLIDEIEYEPMFKPISNIFTAEMITKRLHSTFNYRHTITKNDLKLLEKYPPKEKYKIAISGSSGLIGKALIPLLQTHGHEIVRIVRQKTEKDDEITFDIKEEKFIGNTNNIDIVINLAGKPIGDSRWTLERKKEFESSRIAFTRALVNALCKLDNKPKRLINASAIGFYGNSKEILTETSPKGDLYISHLCNQWEEASKNDNFETTILRIGVVLSPTGGALKKLIELGKFNLAAILGTGDQYISWITIDDLIYSIVHIIYNDLTGTFNLTAPEPIKQKDLIKIISNKLNRLNFLSLNDKIIKLIYGEMADEILLANNYVLPEKLINTGFQFFFDKIDSALNHLMGCENG
ncbi:MAG: TIGR01777 family oxidoreductase [Deferribacterales bacterium]